MRRRWPGSTAGTSSATAAFFLQARIRGIRSGFSCTAKSPPDPVEPLSVGHVVLVPRGSALKSPLDPCPERHLRRFPPGLQPTGHEALFGGVRHLGVRPACGGDQVLPGATPVHAIRLPLPGGDPPARGLESVATAPAPILGVAEALLLLRGLQRHDRTPFSSLLHGG